MSTIPSIPPPKVTPTETELTPEQRRFLIGASILGLIFVALLIAFIVWMVLPGNEQKTATIRDVFIVLLALESLFIGFTLMILMIQIARLTNLLQHEIKPILENTNETINTVRGTAIFVSENLVDPVIKLNGYIAGIGKLFELLNIFTEPKKKK